MDRTHLSAKPIRLDALRKGRSGTVVGVDQSRDGPESLPQSALRRLVEIGFVAGERVEVVATAFPHGDPMAIRIGVSQFALRRLEAQAVWIAPDAA